MNLCYMTQKRDAARLGPRWILRKGKFGLSASLNSVEAADPELFHTREKLAGESLKARLLKGLKENLFSRKRMMAHHVLKS